MRFISNGHKLTLSGGEIRSCIDINVADSFVKYNKFESSTGSGEARLYVGTREKAEPFFGHDFISNDQVYRAVIHKVDLKYYLETAKNEYIEPENYYKNQENMAEKFIFYENKLNDLEDENYFWIKLHNGLDDTSQNRVYIDGVTDPEVVSFPRTNRAAIYDFLRCILLPVMSKIQINKIHDFESASDEVVLWLRPYIHETSRLNPPSNIREEERRIQNDSSLSSNMKFNLVASRVGQGKFRSDMLERYDSMCAISRSDQINVLEACHIKPWVSSTNIEKLDKKNGIILTRNLHKLFDLGFFTFDRNYNVVFSSFVTEKMKREFYLIDDLVKRELSKSESYLNYHREYIYVEFL